MTDKPKINASISSADASAEFTDAIISTAAQLPDHCVLNIMLNGAGFEFVVTDNNGSIVAERAASYHDVAEWISEP